LLLRSNFRQVARARSRYGLVMLSLLVAGERSADIPERDDLYGWLVGAWDAEVRDLMPDGSWRRGRGEWHFARVLEGRAIQDVWIAPPVGERAGASREGNRYGTSLRTYDRSSGLWHIVWVNPVSGARNDLEGRRDGDRIVQEGTDGDGRAIRWNFSDITASSFLWTGEAATDAGWQLEAEFRLRRRP
jgi:hypothetical protein